MSQKPRPENATALVTGASKGIGAAVAIALAEDGWHVGVNYRSDKAGAEKTVKAHRGRVMEKMQVGSLAALIRCAERVGIPETAAVP